MKRVSLAVLAVLVLLAPAAKADFLTKRDFVSVQLEGVRSAFGAPMGSLAGFSIDWGMLQSKYIASGTRIGYQREMGDGLGQALTLLTGFEGHVPIGEHVLVMPGLSLGLRLAQNFGYAAYFDLGLAWRQSDYYFGAAFETPVFLQGGNGANPLFPAIYSANALVGFYY